MVLLQYTEKVHALLRRRQQKTARLVSLARRFLT